MSNLSADDLSPCNRRPNEKTHPQNKDSDFSCRNEAGQNTL